MGNMVLLLFSFEDFTKTEKHNLLIGGWIQTVEIHHSELLNIIRRLTVENILLIVYMYALSAS